LVIGSATLKLTIIGGCVPFLYYDALGLFFSSVVVRKQEEKKEKKSFLERVLIDLLS
jgi:hypothetical protein